MYGYKILKIEFRDLLLIRKLITKLRYYILHKIQTFRFKKQRDFDIITVNIFFYFTQCKIIALLLCH